MKRLATAAVAVPLALAAVFRLPGPWFFLLCLVLIDWGAIEFMRLLRPALPGAPLWLLPLLVPAVALVLVLAVGEGALLPGGERWLLGALAALPLGVGSAVLVLRTPLEEVLGALGALAFGIPYFALPIASLYWLQQHDPWVVFLLCAIVWLGDTAALYAGTYLGRRRMAPVVSPKKTWEGAAAGFLIGVAATAVWSFFQFGGVRWPLLAAGAGTAVAAQVGDLVESLLKRATGVKDSGGILPGHGGMLDRMDAMLFAAPALLFGLWLIGVPVGRP